MPRLLALAPLFVALGCADTATPPPDSQPTPAEKVESDGKVELTPISVADFEKAIQTQYEGKVVAVDVWFLGCAPCKKAMPETVALAKEYAGKGAVVMTLDQMPEDLEQKADVLKFLESVHATMPNYIFNDPGIQGEDTIYQWKERAGFRPTPAMVFYAKDGTLMKSIVAPSKAQIVAELDRLLAQ